MAIQIETFFDSQTDTFSFVVTDLPTKEAVVIDPVMDFDLASGKLSTASADAILDYIRENQLSILYLLETHIHADHLTASHYLQQHCGGKITIGANIQKVLDHWIPLYHTDIDPSGQQFDLRLHEGDTLTFGETTLTVLHTPGHTPACSTYRIEDALFVGDTLFLPDVGTARTDFPGGSAKDLYHSIQKLLAHPPQTRIFSCHDYPTGDRRASPESTVAEQRRDNILIHEGISELEFVTARNQRDENKAVPKLLLPALQYNLRAGRLGKAEENGLQYFKIPVGLFQ